jgi:hypothetical protein
MHRRAEHSEVVESACLHLNGSRNAQQHDELKIKLILDLQMHNFLELSLS